MSQMSRTRFWFSLIGTLVLIAAILGGGYMAYRFGYSQGAIAEQAGETEGVPQPFLFYGYRFYYPHFGIGSLFFGLLFLFLIFGLIKRLLFFPFWGWHRRPYMYKGWKHRHMPPWFWDDEEDEEPEGGSESS
jgi:hypothetical protein